MLRAFPDKRWITERGGVDSNLVCASVQYSLNVCARLDSAAHSNGHEYILNSSFEKLNELIPSIEACDGIDVEEFVCALVGVAPGELIGLSNNAESFKVDSFHDVRPLDVKARDYS